MDFIERWFHISPDGGNGSLEILYVVAIAALVVIALSRHRLGEMFAGVVIALGKRNGSPDERRGDADPAERANS